MTIFGITVTSSAAAPRARWFSFWPVSHRHALPCYREGLRHASGMARTPLRSQPFRPSQDAPNANRNRGGMPCPRKHMSIKHGAPASRYVYPQPSAPPITCAARDLRRCLAYKNLAVHECRGNRFFCRAACNTLHLSSLGGPAGFTYRQGRGSSPPEQLFTPPRRRGAPGGM